MNILVVLVAVSATTVATAEVLSLNKGVVVRLFEWRYPDIARECEEFLSPYGYTAVEISPPSENVIVNTPERPWWERYQPISYKLVTRSGSQQELQYMLQRCNKVGIRVIADVVLNHMTGPGESLVGVGGSTADANDYSYPAVPYTAADFHRPACAVHDYNNATEVRNCELLGLRDINNSRGNVRQIQVGYLNTLIDMGVAGFRIDAAKHMWPLDLQAIYSRLDNLNTDYGFPPDTRPIIYQEVIDMGGEAVKYQEYAPLGLVTDFRYGNDLGRSFLGQSDLVYLKNFGPEWNLLPDNTGVVFVDNHDTQRGSNANILNYKRFRPYKMALAFMLAFPYGTPEVLSSFYFDKYDQGPPHDADYRILSPQPIRDNLCSNRWVCEHRWRQVYNMVRFHNVVRGTAVTNWWDNGKNQIAFCRGNKGFIAFNREMTVDLDRTMQTCLPKGKYCDVISGNLVNNACTGKTVEVTEDGTGHIEIRRFDMYDTNVENDGVLAIHVKAVIVEKKSSGQGSDDKIDVEIGSNKIITPGQSGGTPGSKPDGSHSGNDNRPPSGGSAQWTTGECHCATGSKPVAANPSQNPSGSSSFEGAFSSNPSGGSQSPPSSAVCDTLLRLLATGDLPSVSGTPCQQSVFGSGVNDLTLLTAVARIRKMEKLLNVLSLL